MDWPELLNNIFIQPNSMMKYVDRDPAVKNSIDVIEQTLQIQVPGELESFLLYSDGIIDQDGCHIILPVQGIIDINRRMRDTPPEMSMSFDQLLFFSDWYGTGDYAAFGMPCKDDQEPSGIFQWHHEDDSRISTDATLVGWLKRIAQS